MFVPWLARFARTLGVDAWLVLAGTAVTGWYFHPLIWLALGPVVLAYYLVFAPRHGPAWHLGLAGISFAGVAPNAWWLVDWGKYWWLRQPLTANNIPIPSWGAVIGGPADYPPMFGCLPGGMLLMLGGIAGTILLWRSGHRAAAGLLALAAGVTILVARVAGAWPAVSPDVPDRVTVLAAAFLVPPTAFGLWTLLQRLRMPVIGTSAAVAALLLIGWVDGRSHPLARGMGIAAEPLLIGFTDEQRDLIAVLKQHTTPDARILWDETAGDRSGWNWSALLPLLTGRSYLGGLDPDSRVEHSYCTMCSRQLTGRVLTDWTESELEAFCRWYNVGWVVARSPEAVERWGNCPLAKPVARLKEGGLNVVVYSLDRPRSFILSGTATWESADTRRIVLTDVVPDAEGQVHLSLHHLEGLRASPSYVQVQPLQDPTGRDPVHQVRLLIPGPVPRVTLMWENP